MANPNNDIFNGPNPKVKTETNPKPLFPKIYERERGNFDVLGLEKNIRDLLKLFSKKITKIKKKIVILFN